MQLLLIWQLENDMYSSTPTCSLNQNYIHFYGRTIQIFKPGKLLNYACSRPINIS